jgi:Tfp pilus assembly protein PilF
MESHPTPYLFCAIGLALAAAICAHAQTGRPQTDLSPNDKTGRGSIRGRVLAPDGSFVTQHVKLTLQTFREDVMHAFTDNQGQFEFPGLTPGNYKLEVQADPQRFEVFTTTLQVFRGTPTVVDVTLKEKANTAPTKPAAVSLSELERNVPAAAKKEFERGTQAANAGKTDEAIAHLRKAISIFPSYASAYNDLGTYFLAQGKLEDAAEAFRSAIKLDEKAFNPLLNLGIVLVHQKKFAEAFDVLAKAESQDPASPAAHLYNGMAAAGLNRFETAERQLKAAYSLGDSRYAIALFYLGQLYLTNADRKHALEFFEQYLEAAPAAANSEQVRQMIARLRQ